MNKSKKNRNRKARRNPPTRKTLNVFQLGGVRQPNANTSRWYALTRTVRGKTEAGGHQAEGLPFAPLFFPSYKMAHDLAELVRQNHGQSWTVTMIDPDNLPDQFYGHFRLDETTVVYTYYVKEDRQAA